MLKLHKKIKARFTFLIRPGFCHKIHNMEAKFSQKVKDVISFSKEEAMRLNHGEIGLEHLILGLLREGESLAVQVLKSLNADVIILRRAIEDNIGARVSHQHIVNANNIPLTRETEKTLKITVLEAKKLNSEIIGTEHLMLSILKSKDNIAVQILNQLDVNYETFKSELEYLLNQQNMPSNEYPNDPEDEYDDEKRSGYSSSSRKPNIKSKTPALNYKTPMEILENV